MKLLTRMYEKLNKMPLIGKVGLLLVVCLTLFNGYTVAKYVFQRESEPLYVAENFYFESDALEVEGVNGYPSYTLKNGEDKIRVQFHNYPDKLRRSETELKYKIILQEKATGNEVASIIGTLYPYGDKKTINGVEKYVDAHDLIVEFGGTGKSVTETWSDNDSNNVETYIVEPVSLSEGTYVVAASIISPYKYSDNEMLKADYIITSADNQIDFSVNDADNSPILRLTISTEENFGKFKISWENAEIVADNTEFNLEDISATSCYIDFEKYSEYTIVFFKEDLSKVYSKADFKVTKVVDEEGGE